MSMAASSVVAMSVRWRQRWPLPPPVDPRVDAIGAIMAALPGLGLPGREIAVVALIGTVRRPPAGIE